MIRIAIFSALLLLSSCSKSRYVYYTDKDLNVDLLIDTRKQTYAFWYGPQPVTFQNKDGFRAKGGVQQVGNEIILSPDYETSSVRAKLEEGYVESNYGTKFVVRDAQLNDYSEPIELFVNDSIRYYDYARLINPQFPVNKIRVKIDVIGVDFTAEVKNKKSNKLTIYINQYFGKSRVHTVLYDTINTAEDSAQITFNDNQLWLKQQPISQEKLDVLEEAGFLPDFFPDKFRIKRVVN